MEAVHEVDIASRYKSGSTRSDQWEFFAKPRFKRDSDLDLEVTWEKFGLASEPIAKPESCCLRPVGLIVQHSLDKRTKRQELSWHFDLDFDKDINVLGWNFPNVFNLKKNTISFGIVVDAVNANISTKAINDRLIHALGLPFHYFNLVLNGYKLPLHRGQLIAHRALLFPDERDGLFHLFQLPPIYVGGSTYSNYKKKRKNNNRLKPLLGITLIIVSLPVVWSGVAEIYARDPLGLALVALGVGILWHGMSHAITDKKHDSGQPRDKGEINENFNGESFPSHLGGNCNTNSLDKQDKV